MPIMGGKSKNEEDGYWGYLIQPDKSPSPLLQELLLGIAHYIVSTPLETGDKRILTSISEQACYAMGY